MMWGWTGWLGTLSMIVFSLAVVAFAVWAFKQSSGGSSQSRAKKILEERFARGDIDKAEFDSRSQSLGSL